LKSIRHHLFGLWSWISPPVPDDIAVVLHRAQFENVRKQAPMLLSVAALNVVIIMAVCVHDKLPLNRYAWMSGLVLYCLVRILFLVRRHQTPVKEYQIPGLLRINLAASITMISGLGIATTYTYLAGTFASDLLIPMSLGFGSTSIAHCLYTLRPAALGSVIMGLFPSSIAMIAIGNFDAKMLGIAMLSVGILMIRFVTAQHQQLIVSLQLERQNHALANTDALTGLANRRAIMAELAKDEAAGQGFALALLDLDGFKQVNDELGHHIGDTLLQEVAHHLSSAVQNEDVVGRLGGDEFVILLRNINDEADVSCRCQDALLSLCQPLMIDEHKVPVAASLGYALFPENGANADALLQAADKTLYRSKRERQRISRAQSTPTQYAA
jgi:diguanylate cyclase